MKVGLIAFNSAVRGIFPSEQKVSNSAVVNSGFYKFLVDHYGAELYVIGGIQKRTEDMINDPLTAEKYPYARNVKICRTWEEIPRDLDLIVCDQSAENLRFTIGFDGTTVTGAFHTYKVMAEFPTVPFVYFTPDFGCPLWLPEHYGGLFSRVFKPELIYQRPIAILPAGSPSNLEKNAIADKYRFRHAGVKFLYQERDIHFFCALPEEQMPVRETAEISVAVAGKNRRFGNRATELAEIVAALDPDTHFNLIGKWEDDVVAKIKGTRTDEQFKYSGQLGKYEEVLKKYNEAGITIYLSTEEYRNIRAFTSRILDALAAGCVPLIWKHDRDHMAYQFNNSEIIGLLSVDETTINDVINKLRNPVVRTNVLKRLAGLFLEIQANVQAKVGNVIDSLLDERLSPETLATIPPFIKEEVTKGFMTQWRNKAKTREEAEERYATQIAPVGLREQLLARPDNCKMQMGVFMTHPKEDTMSDVPSEKLDKLCNTGATRELRELIKELYNV